MTAGRDRLGSAEGPTVGDLLRHATAELRRAGIEDAGSEARRVLAAATGLSAARVLGWPESRLRSQDQCTFNAFLRRRKDREPLSRIVGSREFYGRSFTVTPATLDPRPDSETLIDTVLDLVRRDGSADVPLRILDVGTGSGCLLLTLLCELPNARGMGSDLSAGAVEIASRNAQQLGLGERACWRIADALDGIEGPFDILICNPPYIPTADITGLDREVSTFDPALAIDGGPDGLRLYRRLAPRIPLVVPNGWAVLEVGCGQAKAVAGILSQSPFTIDPARIACFRDVAGIRRCVAAITRA